MPTVSFVVPLRDEEEVLPELHRRLDSVAAQIEGECEFILVDDGSTDRSREVMSELRGRDERVKLLILARNFGHQLAISAGLDFAAGDAVVIIDGDLQDPPEVVLEMIPLWREGYEIVHAVRRGRAGESRMKLWTAHRFYRLMRRLSDIEIPVDAGDFRLVDRRVADIVRSMREPDRYLRGMFAWVGFRQTNVIYDRDERFAGKTKNSWAKMISFAIDGILGFSVAPLRFILGLGFVISLLSVAMGMVAIVVKLTGYCLRGAGVGVADGAGHIPRGDAADRARHDRALRRARLRAGEAPSALPDRQRRGPRGGALRASPRRRRTAPRAAANRVDARSLAVGAPRVKKRM